MFEGIESVSPDEEGASTSDANEPSVGLPAIDADEENILRSLQRLFPRTQNNYDLQADTSISRKTVGTKLNRLIEIGLAERRPGPKGATITALGRELLRHLPTVQE